MFKVRDYRSHLANVLILRHDVCVRNSTSFAKVEGTLHASVIKTIQHSFEDGARLRLDMLVSVLLIG